jgi:hypothetical protein
MGVHPQLKLVTGVTGYFFLLYKCRKEYETAKLKKGRPEVANKYKM